MDACIRCTLNTHIEIGVPSTTQKEKIVKAFHEYSARFIREYLIIK